MTTTISSANLRWPRRSLLAAAGISIIALAGCGGGNSNSPSGQGDAAGSGTTTTVQTRTVAGHQDVLTDPSGRTLYTSDQETGGKALCTSSACNAVWLPLTVPAGQSPTGAAQTSADLSTLMRPDGKIQVTFKGMPLYTFSFDHGPGQNGGDGQKDTFDGTNFTWHTATTGTGSVAPAPSTYNPGGY
jgi:predicted lipoprotein with Yx(FWY)xxD motif